MKQIDAQNKILELYKEFLTTPNSNYDKGSGYLPFYIWLEKNYPSILNFRCSGDKYQTIACWMMEINKN